MCFVVSDKFRLAETILWAEKTRVTLCSKVTHKRTFDPLLVVLSLLESNYSQLLSAKTEIRRSKKWSQKWPLVLWNCHKFLKTKYFSFKFFRHVVRLTSEWVPLESNYGRFRTTFYWASKFSPMSNHKTVFHGQVLVCSISTTSLLDFKLGSKPLMNHRSKKLNFWCDQKLKEKKKQKIKRNKKRNGKMIEWLSDGGFWH